MKIHITNECYRIRKAPVPIYQILVNMPIKSNMHKTSPFDLSINKMCFHCVLTIKHSFLCEPNKITIDHLKNI